MTILKAANGKEIDTEQFKDKGYGAFTQFVQQHIDSKWGTGEVKDSGPGLYSIKFKATKTVSCYADLTIEADTEEEAREKGLREAYRQQDILYWDNGIDEEITDIEIDEVEKEEKGKENEKDLV